MSEIHAPLLNPCATVLDFLINKGTEFSNEGRVALVALVKAGLCSKEEPIIGADNLPLSRCSAVALVLPTDCCGWVARNAC